MELAINNTFLTVFMSLYQILSQVLQMKELFSLLLVSFKVLLLRTHHIREFEYSSIVTAITPPSASRFFNARQNTPVTPQRFPFNLTLSVPNMPAPKITNGIFCWYWLNWSDKNLLALYHKLYINMVNVYSDNFFLVLLYRGFPS